VPNRDRLAAAVLATTAGSESWAKAMDELAESWVRDGDLTQAIAIRRGALAGPAADVPLWIRLDLSTNHGIDLMDRYRRDGDLNDLLAACALGEQVWAASPAGSRLEVTANLAGRLSVLAAATGYPDPEERARTRLEQELAAASAADPQHPLVVAALAGVHLQRWQRDGDRDRLAAAVRAVTVGLHPQTAGPATVNVAGLVAEAAEQSGDHTLLALAEQMTRAGLDSPRPATATVRVALHRLLASVLLTRYDWVGDTGALTEATGAAQEAVRAATTDPDRALARSVRSTVRSAAARLRNDRPGFTAAIDDVREALRLTGDHAAESEYATNLGSLLAERYDLFGDSTDLDESITLLDRLLDGRLAPDVSPTVANNRATNLLARFEAHRDPADLDRAIVLAEAAVAETAPGNPEIAATLIAEQPSLRVRPVGSHGLARRAVHELTRLNTTVTASSSSAASSASTAT
jgi:hypothetical protein